MATTRVMGMRPRSPVDSEEFLQHLYRGGELLAQGKLIEARECLESAHGQQPRSEKAQNLLGLTYFKLGLFDRAAEIYETLIRDNPVDATLRVNLGLVYLKTNALQRAIREFELATDLAPDHKKAHNYLGLALAQAGQYGRARTHFLRAGSEGMAQRMVRAIAGEGFTPPRPVQPAQARGFAEIEGHEVVAERGGEQVQEPPARRPSAPPPAPVAAPGAALPPAAAAGPAAAAPAAAAVPAAVAVPAAAAPAAAAPAAAAPAAAARPSAAAEQGWGAQFGLDEAPGSGAVPPVAQLHFVEDGAAALRGAAEPPAEPAAGEPSAEAEAAPAAQGAPAAEAAPAAEVAPGAEQAEQAYRLEPVAEGATPAPWARMLDSAPAAAGGTWQGAHVLSLGTLAPAVQLESAGEVSSSFQPGRHLFSLHVEGELLTRLQGLVAWSGSLRFLPEMKRFRGRATDRPFGEGAARVMRASGQGVLHVEPEERTFLALSLAGDSAYFREHCVFAFDESVVFENGRVPSDMAPDLDLVHLRGQGRVLLCLEGALRSLPVRPEEPLAVSLSHLVGWQGDLSPRVVRPLESEPGRVALELAGEGFALITLPVR